MCLEKIYTGILVDRVRKVTEELLIDDEQGGFAVGMRVCKGERVGRSS